MLQVKLSLIQFEWYLNLQGKLGVEMPPINIYAKKKKNRSLAASFQHHKHLKVKYDRRADKINFSAFLQIRHRIEVTAKLRNLSKGTCEFSVFLSEFKLNCV